MITAKPTYSYEQKGRGYYAAAATGFTAVLAVVFFLTRDPMFVACGAFLTLFVFSGVYAFIKGETWSMNIEDDVLRWTYARWPKSSGQVELSAVCGMVIDDSASALSMTLKDGSSRKIKLIGHGSQLRDFLAKHHPQITVEYQAGT